MDLPGSHKERRGSPRGGSGAAAGPRQPFPLGKSRAEASQQGLPPLRPAPGVPARGQQEALGPGQLRYKCPSPCRGLLTER